MAYPRPAYDNRSPAEPEHKRPPWDPIPRPPFHAMPPSSVSSTPSTVAATIFDPESEDSDVSITPGDVVSATALPQGLPTPPPKHALESPDTVQAHLNELSRVEDHNIKKHRRLAEKRARKDERIQRKRALQDAKIKAIMDARSRHDARIERRRQWEDAAFQRFYDELEDEETRLRHRLKRLKRGLPVDEQNVAGRSISSSSMSPPGPAYSTIPPPAKRHQTGPPGHNESPLSTASRDPRPHPSAATVPPSGPSPVPASGPPTIPAPSYHFYQGGPAPQVQQQSPYQVPYHAPPAYNRSPQVNAPPVPLPPRTAPTPSDSVYAVNGQPPSPLAARPPSHPQLATPSVAPPLRQSSAGYDTRPPPPASSGFATINQPTPPQSGFAAINPRSTETPPQQPGLNRDLGLPGSHRPMEYTPSRPYASESTPTSATGSLLPSSNKRTPSTTHPYQMSEAFANRHHHCEKTDSLNRGIWTWYGPGGTQEQPTGAPTQMYLKCNHDNCGRIDWRTVHGLQCHIVKNHEQPKGTIGSLEKALEKYGVPVRDIEEIEKRDGLGAGGTMADPKNLKMKAKGRDANDKRDSDRKSTPSSAAPTPIVHRTSHTSSTDSPTQSASLPRMSGAGVRDDSESDATPIEEKRAQGSSGGGFAAVNNAWPTVSTASSLVHELKHHDMHDVPSSHAKSNTHPASTRSPFRASESSTPWPKLAQASEPVREPASTLPTPESQPSASEIKPLAAGIHAPGINGAALNNQLLPANGSSARSGEERVRETTLGAGSVLASESETANQPADVSMTGMSSEITADTSRSAEAQHGSKDKEDATASALHGADGTKDGDEEIMKPPLSTSDGSRSAMHSPEIPSKRVSAAGSRRGSRRSSMVTAGSRNVSEKDREYGIDGIKLSEEDDGETIVIHALDRTRTPPRRMANGRYMRKVK